MCDIALGIINPVSYGKDSFKDYNLAEFNKSAFRSIHVMKNRYGRSPASSCVGLLGITGWMYQLPAVMAAKDYFVVNTTKELHKKYITNT